jgi:hypothetical protein
MQKLDYHISMLDGSGASGIAQNLHRNRETHSQAEIRLVIIMRGRG